MATHQFTRVLSHMVPLIQWGGKCHSKKGISITKRGSKNNTKSTKNFQN